MFYLKLGLGTLLAGIGWLAIVFLGGFYGWWMAPVVAPGDAEGFIEYATRRLDGENPGNSALVVIDSGRIIHEHYSDSPDPINRDTVFATASMSKWFAAYGVMTLVADGRLDLDAPVSNFLTRWQLPPGEFDNGQVTVRRLLSHTAGFSDGLGFGDYGADEELPSLEASLSRPRASSNREVSIAVTAQPGAGFEYSGGGYLMLELIVEEVSGQRVADYMGESVFDPLGMSRSGYGYLAADENHAGSYDREGEPAPIYQYASRAATAFVTSAGDLTRFVLAQLPYAQPRGPLDDAWIKAMREPHAQTLGIDIWGLGTILYAPTAGGDFVFGHDGANDPAINTAARINPDTGDAIIVLVTGHPSLATNIGSDWVLWQTGYPDALASDAVMASMVLPGVAGLLLVLLGSLWLGYRLSCPNPVTLPLTTIKDG